jgi:hypothetical protein
MMVKIFSELFTPLEVSVREIGAEDPKQQKIK